MNQRVLTGITTTGTPHLGNYVGAIRPAIAASKAPVAGLCQWEAMFRVRTGSPKTAGTEGGRIRPGCAVSVMNRLTGRGSR